MTRASKPVRALRRDLLGPAAWGMVLAALVVLPCVAGAQTASLRETDRRDTELSERLSALREATRGGAVAEAVRLADALVADYPENDRVYWAAASTYRFARAYRERLIPHLERRVSRAPDDLRAREELGEIYALEGEFERAHETWLVFLRHGKPHKRRYSEIGAREINLGMPAYAVEVFLEARERFGEPTLFAEELATAYAALQEYEKALDEAFVAVRAHPGIVQWAVNRALVIIEEGGSADLVLDYLDERAGDPKITASELGIVGGVRLALDDGAGALEAFLAADRLSGGVGTQLFGYAHLLRDAGKLAEARDAFLMVADRHPNSPQAARARVLGAGMLVVLGEPAEATLELREIAESFERDEDVADALIRVAAIELRELSDPAAAVATLRSLGPILDRLSRAGSPVAAEAMVLHVDASLARGDFDGAAERIGALLAATPTGATRERALFLDGYLRFLLGDPEGSTSRLRSMVEADPGGEYVNDALRLMIAISGGRDDPEAVSLLAEGHAAAIAGDRAGAADAVWRLADKHAGTAAATEGLMLLGAIAEDGDDLDRALEVYRRVADETGSVAARAEALVRRGDIYRTEVGRPDLALAEYERLVNELPPNYLSGEARRRIESLRREGVITG